MMDSKMLSFLLIWLLFALLIGIVLTTFESRKVFIEWQQMEDQVYQLDIEHGQLLLQKSTQASLILVDEFAKTKLAMEKPKGRKFQVIKMQ